MRLLICLICPKQISLFLSTSKKGVGPASRVFTATSAFIHACEQIDADLVESIDTTIEPVMVLEDIEVGSLKTWLGVALKSTDDQGIKN